ncbi:MAG: tetratricopeptide repeat protein [Planctomycetaceae bacterium]
MTNEFDLEVTPYCEWLKLARIQKAVIAWLDGTEPTSIVAHDGWSLENGSGLERHSETEAGLEFLRREGGIEAYFDKKAGKEVYLARKDPSVDALNAAFKKSAEDIHANWIQPGQKPISGKSAAAVQTAIRALEEVVASCPEHWQSHLMIGKGWQALGNEQAAYDAMGLAFQHCEDNESVPREFAGLCLQMGRADEAVRIGERAASLRPDNHETLGNLACAYLVSGHFVEAKKTIDAALKLNPSDSINRNLARILNDVSSGRRPQPRNLIELMTEPQQDKSFWKQLQFWER